MRSEGQLEAVEALCFTFLKEQIDKSPLFQSTSLKSEEQLAAVVAPCLTFLKELEEKENSSNTINYMSIRS